jgi:hypothetical protein
MFLQDTFCKLQLEVGLVYIEKQEKLKNNKNKPYGFQGASRQQENKSLGA